MVVAIILSTSVQQTTDSTVVSGDRVGMYQIGEVAERVRLSLRTVRYYEEVGLLDPLARTQGHFRLFTERDVERLLIIMQMKPTGFTLEEMREQLEIRDRLKDKTLEPANTSRLSNAWPPTRRRQSPAGSALTVVETCQRRTATWPRTLRGDACGRWEVEGACEALSATAGFSAWC